MKNNLLRNERKIQCILNMISFVCQMEGCFVINTHVKDPIVMWQQPKVTEKFVHFFLWLKGKWIVISEYVIFQHNVDDMWVYGVYLRWSLPIWLFARPDCFVGRLVRIGVTFRKYHSHLVTMYWLYVLLSNDGKYEWSVVHYTIT